MRAISFTSSTFVVLLIAQAACQQPSPRYRGVGEPPKQMADEYVSFSGPPGNAPEGRPPGHGTRGSVATPAALATGGTAQRAREALDGPVGADASFAPAPGIVAFQGAGRLAEVPEGVQIAVAVRQAPPGEPALRLVSDKEACSDFLGIAATGPVRVSQGEKLGTLQVERGGEALVKVTVPNVNLKAGDPRSLLGKSLLLDSVAPQKGAPGTPLACAPITDNPPPARR